MTSAAPSNRPVVLGFAVFAAQNGDCFALPLDEVAGAVRLQHVSRVPFTDPWVLGVGCHADTFFPVLDLTARIERRATTWRRTPAPTQATPILALQVMLDRVVEGALWLDAPPRVLYVAPEALEVASGIGPEENGNLVNAVLRSTELQGERRHGARPPQVALVLNARRLLGR